MAFVDPYLLTLTLVMTLVLVFGNMYFLAHYAHFADSFFGSSTAAKAILVSANPLSFLMFLFQVVGYMLALSQILLLPLDVQNTREDTNLDMRYFWYII